MSYFVDLPLAISGPIVLAIAILFSELGLELAHRYGDQEKLRKNHDVAGFIYAVITVAYAVIMGFVVIVVWENFTRTEHVCQEEANGIGDLLRLTSVFPDSVKADVDHTVLKYLHGVVEREWNTMDHAEEDPATLGTLADLWKVYNRYDPATWKQQQYFKASLKKLAELDDNRRLRIIASHSSLPPIMWALLLGGGFLSIAFTFLFSAPTRWVQRVITAMLSSMIALVLFLIFAVDHPLSGEVKVQPEAYRHLIEHMNAEGIR